MMNLSPHIQSFVLHFGEMGSRWGISRTVAQIYALLFVSARPLCAEELAAALGISRSNVSISLRELQAWNLVLMRHLPNDRRDFFATPEDVWQIVRTLAEERKKREVDPTLAVLSDILARPPGDADERFAHDRMRQMHGLTHQLSGWYDEVKRLDNARLTGLMALGAKVSRLLDAAEKILPRRRRAVEREETQS